VIWLQRRDAQVCGGSLEEQRRLVNRRRAVEGVWRYTSSGVEVSVSAAAARPPSPLAWGLEGRGRAPRTR
jgi:hypothetical protein